MDTLLPIIAVVLIALWAAALCVWCYHLGKLRGMQEMADYDKQHEAFFDKILEENKDVLQRLKQSAEPQKEE